MRSNTSVQSAGAHAVQPGDRSTVSKLYEFRPLTAAGPAERSTVRGSIVWLSERDSPDAFPPVDRALREPDGLLAAGGDLSPPRLLAAYRRGIFPWYSRGQPILWWCPDPRAVLFPGEFTRLAQPRARSMRNKGFVTRIDTAFRDVIRACGSTRAAPGRHLAVAGDARRLHLRLHRSAMRIRSRPGRTSGWSAGCTASRSGACSSASRCSAPNATPPRSR